MPKQQQQQQIVLLSAGASLRAKAYRKYMILLSTGCITSSPTQRQPIRNS